MLLMARDGSDKVIGNLLVVDFLSPSRRTPKCQLWIWIVVVINHIQGVVFTPACDIDTWKGDAHTGVANFQTQKLTGYSIFICYMKWNAAHHQSNLIALSFQQSGPNLFDIR
jgi:hypothetical protein